MTVELEPIQIPVTVMIASDDEDIVCIWAFSLEQIAIKVISCDLSERAIRLWADELPDMVVVDNRCWQMEDVEFCRKLRQETVIPILLFTSQNDEYYLLEAYNAGVAEVVPQPISPRLFIAKIQSWLRWTRSLPSNSVEKVQAGGATLHVGNRQLSLPQERTARLTYLETRLLYILMSHPDQLVATEILVERIWGMYQKGDTAMLKNLVYRLRRKIEADPSKPRYLITEGNAGYKFNQIKKRRSRSAAAS